MAIKNENPVRWTPLGAGRKLGVEFEYCHEDGDNVIDGMVYEGDWDGLLDDEYIPAIKEDCSVDGAELVTQPADLLTHKKRIPELMRNLRQIGFFADGTCGLHVHVERKSEADMYLTAFLLQAVMATHSTPWDNLLHAIHGRNIVDNEYCWATSEYIRRNDQTIMDIFPNCLEEVKAWPTAVYGNKFWRINFCHKDTYEFRMGHSSMRLERIFRRLEFALAAVTWVEEMGEKLLRTTMEQEVNMFTDWVHQNDFPFLSAFLHTLD